ncbi:hypothetical protein [Stenomitos frigidus]|uniref:hypothetical protein n=1 Tax=Stenomitos frigidus TaxID=1886765 RepID=UPI0015E67188|nr:hypothetical protein [Stenomitos frigidus]
MWIKGGVGALPPARGGTPAPRPNPSVYCYSGADLAHFLKNTPETAHLPIILVTAYAMLNER